MYFPVFPRTGDVSPPRRPKRECPESRWPNNGDEGEGMESIRPWPGEYTINDLPVVVESMIKSKEATTQLCYLMKRMNQKHSMLYG
jgi:hypothetical protein